jgi:aromatic ring hydroxylase
MQVALKLTNCLLKNAKKQIVKCSERKHLDDYTSQLRGDPLTSHTNFHTHIDNLCYYYRSLIWEGKTEQLITNLSETTADTKHMLIENLQSTKEILTSQKSLRSRLSCRDYYMMVFIKTQKSFRVCRLT